MPILHHDTVEKFMFSQAEALIAYLKNDREGLRPTHRRIEEISKEQPEVMDYIEYACGAVEKAIEELPKEMIQTVVAQMMFTFYAILEAQEIRYRKEA